MLSRPSTRCIVNGKLTMGENLADLGGLTIAYTALQKQLKARPEPKSMASRPSSASSWPCAQIWRAATRPEALRQQVLTDPHSPGQYRTIGPLHEHAPVLRSLRLQGRRERVSA